MKEEQGDNSTDLKDGCGVPTESKYIEESLASEIAELKASTKSGGQGLSICDVVCRLRSVFCIINNEITYRTLCISYYVSHTMYLILCISYYVSYGIKYRV